MPTVSTPTPLCECCADTVDACECENACADCGYHYSLCNCVSCDRCDDTGYVVDTDDAFRCVDVACSCEAGDEWRRDQSERRDLAAYNHAHRAGAL